MTLKLVTAMILQRILVMNEDGSMNEKAGKYKGMDRFECRKQIVKDLQDAGVLVEIEEHNIQLVIQNVVAQLLNLIYQHNGSLKWDHLLKKQLNYKRKMKK